MKQFISTSFVQRLTLLNIPKIKLRRVISHWYPNLSKAKIFKLHYRLMKIVQYKAKMKRYQLFRNPNRLIHLYNTQDLIGILYFKYANIHPSTQRCSPHQWTKAVFCFQQSLTNLHQIKSLLHTGVLNTQVINTYLCNINCQQGIRGCPEIQTLTNHLIIIMTKKQFLDPYFQEDFKQKISNKYFKYYISYSDIRTRIPIKQMQQIDPDYKGSFFFFSECACERGDFSQMIHDYWHPEKVSQKINKAGWYVIRKYYNSNQIKQIVSSNPGIITKRSHFNKELLQNAKQKQYRRIYIAFEESPFDSVICCQILAGLTNSSNDEILRDCVIYDMSCNIKMSSQKHMIAISDLIQQNTRCIEETQNQFNVKFMILNMHNSFQYTYEIISLLQNNIIEYKNSSNAQLHLRRVNFKYVLLYFRRFEKFNLLLLQAFNYIYGSALITQAKYVENQSERHKINYPIIIFRSNILRATQNQFVAISNNFDQKISISYYSEIKYHIIVYQPFDIECYSQLLYDDDKRIMKFLNENQQNEITEKAFSSDLNILLKVKEQKEKRENIAIQKQQTRQINNQNITQQEQIQPNQIVKQSNLHQKERNEHSIRQESQHSESEQSNVSSEQNTESSTTVVRRNINYVSHTNRSINKNVQNNTVQTYSQIEKPDDVSMFDPLCDPKQISVSADNQLLENKLYKDLYITNVNQVDINMFQNNKNDELNNSIKTLENAITVKFMQSRNQLECSQDDRWLITMNDEANFPDLLEYIQQEALNGNSACNDDYQNILDKFRIYKLKYYYNKILQEISSFKVFHNQYGGYRTKQQIYTEIQVNIQKEYKIVQRYFSLYGKRKNFRKFKYITQQDFQNYLVELNKLKHFMKTSSDDVANYISCHCDNSEPCYKSTTCMTYKCEYQCPLFKHAVLGKEQYYDCNVQRFYNCGNQFIAMQSYCYDMIIGLAPYVGVGVFSTARQLFIDNSPLYYTCYRGEYISHDGFVDYLNSHPDEMFLGMDVGTHCIMSKSTGAIAQFFSCVHFFNNCQTVKIFDELGFAQCVIMLRRKQGVRVNQQLTIDYRLDTTGVVQQGITICRCHAYCCQSHRLTLLDHDDVMLNIIQKFNKNAQNIYNSTLMLLSESEAFILKCKSNHLNVIQYSKIYQLYMLFDSKLDFDYVKRVVISKDNNYLLALKQLLLEKCDTIKAKISHKQINNCEGNCIVKVYQRSIKQLLNQTSEDQSRIDIILGHICTHVPLQDGIDLIKNIIWDFTQSAQANLLFRKYEYIYTVREDYGDEIFAQLLFDRIFYHRHIPQELKYFVTYVKSNPYNVLVWVQNINGLKNLITTKQFNTKLSALLLDLCLFQECKITMDTQKCSDQIGDATINNSVDKKYQMQNKIQQFTIDVAQLNDNYDSCADLSSYKKSSKVIPGQILEVIRQLYSIAEMIRGTINQQLEILEKNANEKDNHNAYTNQLIDLIHLLYLTYYRTKENFTKKNYKCDCRLSHIEQDLQYLPHVVNLLACTVAEQYYVELTFQQSVSNQRLFNNLHQYFLKNHPFETESKEDGNNYYISKETLKNNRNLIHKIIYNAVITQSFEAVAANNQLVDNDLAEYLFSSEESKLRVGYVLQQICYNPLKIRQSTQPKYTISDMDVNLSNINPTNNCLLQQQFQSLMQQNSNNIPKKFKKIRQDQEKQNKNFSTYLNMCVETLNTTYNNNNIQTNQSTLILVHNAANGENTTQSGQQINQQPPLAFGLQNPEPATFSSEEENDQALINRKNALNLNKYDIKKYGNVRLAEMQDAKLTSILNRCPSMTYDEMKKLPEICQVLHYLFYISSITVLLFEQSVRLYNRAIEDGVVKYLMTIVDYLIKHGDNISASFKCFENLYEQYKIYELKDEIDDVLKYEVSENFGRSDEYYTKHSQLKSHIEAHLNINDTPTILKSKWKLQFPKQLCECNVIKMYLIICFYEVEISSVLHRMQGYFLQDDLIDELLLDPQNPDLLRQLQQIRQLKDEEQRNLFKIIQGYFECVYFEYEEICKMYKIDTSNLKPREFALIAVRDEYVQNFLSAVKTAGYKIIANDK